jgi:hypothetical protein
MVTTTHDPDLDGAPRLLVCVAGDGTRDQAVGGDQQAFPLSLDRTALGSGDDVDIRLEGTLAAAGEIVHDESDEFVYVDRTGSATINGQAVSTRPLRTGDRLELGPWTLMFFREEYADHGRPFGGRQGGEGDWQKAQPARSEMTPAVEPSNFQVDDGTLNESP